MLRETYSWALRRVFRFALRRALGKHTTKQLVLAGDTRKGTPNDGGWSVAPKRARR